MSVSAPAVSRLMRQAQYAGINRRTVRYAASYYRPTIYVLTTVIIVTTLWEYWADLNPLTQKIMAGMLILYTAFFVFRMVMSGHIQERFYASPVQYVRGQVGLLAVSVIIILLVAEGHTNHELWLLYVLSTLTISEHNSSLTTFVTLIEVAILYCLSSYLGWVLTPEGQWDNVRGLLDTQPHLFVRVAWICLITFVFGYLVRNIQGRDRAYAQQKGWLDLVLQQTVSSDQPAEQQRALVAAARDLVQADAELWLPSLGKDRLVGTHGQPADKQVLDVAWDGRPSIFHVKPLRARVLGNAVVQPIQPYPKGVWARTLIPVRRLDRPSDTIAVFDVQYLGREPDLFKLEMDAARLQDLAGQARLFLVTSRQNQQHQLVERLAANLNELMDVSLIANQVVRDVVDELGLDFATVSLVDVREQTIRCVAGKNANWVEMSHHPMSDKDVQSRTVREGRMYQNNGPWEPPLDKRIWRKFHHGELCRVWIPIMRPASIAGPYPALGTIEAGFHHTHHLTIPPEVIALLNHYTSRVSMALGNAQRLERQRELAESLKALQEISRTIQGLTAIYEPQQMEQLIGQSAEDLLKADLVMVYTWDEARRTLRLPYTRPQADAILGKGELSVSLSESSILTKLYAERCPYFSVDAQADPVLSNLLPDGRPDWRHRTFSQRQRIKSFAGVPLVGKGGGLLGFLCLNYRTHHEFYDEERQIIDLFARQAAVALEETRNHELARRVFISHESKSLMMELHDNLSQNLYALKLRSETARSHAQNGALPSAIASLDQVAQSAEVCMESLTYTLGELQTQPNLEIDFVAGMSNHLARLRDIRGKHIEFRPRVRGEVQRQVQFYLLRIAREAVNNALRHAKDADIRVTYDVSASGGAILTVEDDGPGFDLETARQSGRYGLNSMEYFASRINSQLVINTRVNGGQGTIVSVRVPPPLEERKDGC